MLAAAANGANRCIRKLACALKDVNDYAAAALNHTQSMSLTCFYKKIHHDDNDPAVSDLLSFEGLTDSCAVCCNFVTDCCILVKW